MRISSRDLAEKLLKEANVALTPGRDFGPAGENHLRFSYATSRQEIEKGIEKIGKVIGK